MSIRKSASNQRNKRELRRSKSDANFFEAQAQILKEGYLKKRGEHIKSWRMRYFVLYQNGIFVGYKSKEDKCAGGDANNVFSVVGCDLEVYQDKKKFIISFQGDKECNRTLEAENCEDLLEWTGFITKFTKKHEPHRCISSSAVVRVKNSIRILTEFKKCVGVGSFSEVFLAENKDTHQALAVKVMQKKRILELEEESHIRSEMRIHKLLLNNFITLWIDFSEDTFSIYFYTEFAPGGELYSLMRKLVVLKENHARFYVCELICAVDYLHKNNIVHRDIRPENILLSSSGHIKLADFGLAKFLPVGIFTSTFCGTLQYLAPEILEEQEYGCDVDWWCLGVAFYEMIHGKLPFYSDSEEELISLIKMGKYEVHDRVTNLANDLIRGLLTTIVSIRYGCGSDGVNTLKDHKFFESIDWSDVELLRIPVPYQPVLLDDFDTSYFNETFTSRPLHKYSGIDTSDQIFSFDAKNQDFINETYSFSF